MVHSLFAVRYRKRRQDLRQSKVAVRELEMNFEGSMAKRDRRHQQRNRPRALAGKPAKARSSSTRTVDTVSENFLLYEELAALRRHARELAAANADLFFQLEQLSDYYGHLPVGD